jgi:uncharacterized membrane protein YbhN (UPF0104 family)
VTGEPTANAGRSRLVRVVLRITLVVLTIWIVVGLLSKINFSQVWTAISTLTWREVLVLLALLAVLRTMNAIPISLFIPGLRLPRAVLNDSSAYLVSTVSPPPSDMVLRYSMFKAWDVDVAQGFAGVALNTVLFYAVRFSAPLAGLALLLVATEVESNVVLTASLSALVAIAILTTLVAVVRAKRVAAAVGRTGGRIGHRFKPDDVDPEVWSAKVVDFRAHVGAQLRRTWPWAALAMFGMVVFDGSVLLFSLRSVGITAELLPAVLVYGAFLVGYPLTALPFAGLGVFDALLYTLAVARLGEEYSSALVAALLIWRVITVATPLLIGVVAYGLWRRSNAVAAQPPVGTGYGATADTSATSVVPAVLEEVPAESEPDGAP